MEIEPEFTQGYDGEWIQPVQHGYYIRCCDCGLTHRFDFRVVKLHKNKKVTQIQNQAYKVQYRPWRVD